MPLLGIRLVILNTSCISGLFLNYNELLPSRLLASFRKNQRSAKTLGCIEDGPWSKICKLCCDDQPLEWKKKIKIQLFPRLTWQPLIRILIICRTLDRQCRFPSSVEIHREGWLSFEFHIKLNLCYELADGSVQPKSLIAALYSWRRCTCQTCTKKWRRNSSLRNTQTSPWSNGTNWTS